MLAMAFLPGTVTYLMIEEWHGNTIKLLTKKKSALFLMSSGFF